MHRVYISGKITGLEQSEYQRKFHIAEVELSCMGYNSYINPAFTNGTLPEDLEHDEYMSVCVNGLMPLCDTIYMLSNYKESKGAMEELEIAKQMGMEVLYQEEI